MEINGTLLGLSIAYFLLGYRGSIQKEIPIGVQMTLMVICWAIAILLMTYAF